MRHVCDVDTQLDGAVLVASDAERIVNILFIANMASMLVLPSHVLPESAPVKLCVVVKKMARYLYMHVLYDVSLHVESMCNGIDAQVYLGTECNAVHTRTCAPKGSMLKIRCVARRSRRFAISSAGCTCTREQRSIAIAGRGRVKRDEVTRKGSDGNK